MAIIWAYISLYFAGYLKIHKGMKTGYTRKVFHFIIFISAALINWKWDLSIVCLFGGMVSIVILYAIIRGDGHLLYEAIARENDEPRRTFFILVPYVATLIGGIASNILFGQNAVFGYLVTGMGDAIGEPVGTRYGKHQYQVPTFSAVKSFRSYEGSAAVFFVSLLAIALGISMSPHLNLGIQHIGIIFLMGVVCTFIEAISPHGWDNATLQIIPAFFASYFL